MKPSDSAFQLALICFLVASQTGTIAFEIAGFVWVIQGIGRIWMEDKK